MQPNDLPIVCLPLGLCGEDADTLIDFLYQLIEALEHHYGGLLINQAHQLEPSGSPQSAITPSDHPPF